MNFRKSLCIVFVLIVQFSVAQNKIVVNTDLGKEKISRHIYGIFTEHLGSCIYGGFWVGEDSKIPNTNGIRNDVLNALRELDIPNVRWPGGCFADEYHWMDGIGPRDERPTMINTNWGNITENNHFGTHEFMELCRLLDAEPVICGNLGSGTPKEMSQWIEYLNSDNTSPMTDLRKANGRNESWGVKYWNLGNENWGCGGSMTAEYYTNEMKRFSTFTKNYGKNSLYRIACGPYGAGYDWMETLMRNGNPGSSFQGVSWHYYIKRRWDLISATDFNESDYFWTLDQTLIMDELLATQIDIMDRYDKRNRVGLIVDEWGVWHESEPGTNPSFLYSQSSILDALVASVSLNLFNKYSRRVKMANLSETVNAIHSAILTKDDEDDFEIVKTPTYYVFKMYNVHKDATLLPSDVKSEFYSYGDQRIPAISTSASKAEDGTIHITISNLNPNKSLNISCELSGMDNVRFERGEIITAEKMNSYNDFGKKEEVSLTNFDDVKVNGNLLDVKLPSKSIVMLKLK